MRKGITPIISIIVLLLITVSLAGAAYMFLGNYMSGITGQQIQATALPCVGGDTAYVTITNMGSQQVDLTGCTASGDISGVSTVCGDLTVVMTEPAGGSMNGYFDAASIAASEPGNLDSVTFIDSGCGAGNLCEYAFTRAGELQPEVVTVDCR